MWEKRQDRKKTIALIVAAVLAVALLAIFIIRPSVIGYSVYREAKSLDLSLAEYGARVSELEQDALEASTDLSYCKEFNQKLLADAERITAELASCQSALGEGQKAAGQLQKELQQQNEQNTELQTSYAQLVSNAANNICCKAKVDDSRIDSYKVENNRISCVSGGTLRISC